MNLEKTGINLENEGRINSSLLHWVAACMESLHWKWDALKVKSYRVVPQVGPGWEHDWRSYPQKQGHSIKEAKCYGCLDRGIACIFWRHPFNETFWNHLLICVHLMKKHLCNMYLLHIPNYRDQSEESHLRTYSFSLQESIKPQSLSLKMKITIANQNINSLLII